MFEEVAKVSHDDDAIETVKSDYVDTLNDILADRNLRNIFNGFADTSAVLEVVDVHVDRQQSHIIAFFTSPLSAVLEKRHPPNESAKFLSTANKIDSHITKTLARHEGKIRTALMHQGTFRVTYSNYCDTITTCCITMMMTRAACEQRVPKVEFRPLKARKEDYLSPARLANLLDEIREA